MKTKLFTLLLAVAASVGTMFAEKVQIGDLYYNLDATNQTAEVTSLVDKPWNDGNYEFTTVTIPSSVTYNNVTYSVTNIGYYAFAFCSNLTSVTIPNSVVSLGQAAFSYCSGLTSIELPNSITSIGDYAFQGCTGLTSVIIPNSVVSIGFCSFRFCSNLSAITIPNSVTTIESHAFDSCTSLPIDGNIRYADTYLVEAVNKTKSTYSIRSNTKWIGQDAFMGCNSLTSITIPNSVTSIGFDAFSGCGALTSVTIPNSVKKIEMQAFSNCSSLTSIELPNSITSIENATFYYCSSLTSVTVGENVTSIGGSAFYNCNSLTSITIPNSVTSIGRRAFSGCAGLTSITIGDSVTSIETYAFYGCTSLISILISAKNPPFLGEYALNYCPKLSTINVPCESFDEYKTADGWNRYAEKMKFKGKRYPVEVTTADSIMGLVIAPDTACSNTIIEILAAPNEGFRFKQWSDGNIDNPRAISIEGKVTLIAEFEEIKYSVSLHTNDSAMGRVYGMGEYTLYSLVNCFAIPNDGYKFISWDDGNSDNPRTIVINRDTMLTAVFEEIKYTLSLYANDLTMGKVEGAGTYTHNTQVSCTAIPNQGYEFVCWSNSLTENPYVFIIKGNTTLMAMFQPVSEGLIGTENQKPLPRKILENGQIFILLPDGSRFNVLGEKR